MLSLSASFKGTISLIFTALVLPVTSFAVHNLSSRSSISKLDLHFAAGSLTGTNGLDTPSGRNRSISKLHLASKSSLRQFWTDERDECTFMTGTEPTNNSTTIRSKRVKFTIRGKPLPLNRHRTRRGFMYNPSAAAQEVFRVSLLQIMPKKHHPIIVDDGHSDDAPITFFSPDDFLEMSIVFRLKRPKNHFVNNKPGEGRIKENAPSKFHANRTDIDNLAKFVLDSLNGLLYADDKQVVSLKLIKMLDSEGMCEGAIDVSICVLHDEISDSSFLLDSLNS